MMSETNAPSEISKTQQELDALAFHSHILSRIELLLDISPFRLDATLLDELNRWSAVVSLRALAQRRPEISGLIDELMQVRNHLERLRSWHL